jgi:hypothetical protein
VDVPPLVTVTHDEVADTLHGPAFLYGQAAARARRPNGPGRRGDLLISIDSPYQLFGRSASYLHVAAWTLDGSPAAGASVYIDRRRIGRTNASGTLVSRQEGIQQDDPDRADGFYGSAVFVIDDAGHCGAASFSPYERTATFAVDRLFVYTDRGVFAPGDTVHVRAIGWRLKQDYRPLVAAPIEFLLRNERGQTIAAASAKTDEFGVTALDLPIPRTAPWGYYELRVAYGQERASTSLEVRRLVRPELRIEHTLGRFLLAEPLRALDFQVTLFPPEARALGWVDLEARAQGRGGTVLATVKRRVQGNGPHALSFSKDQVRRLVAGVGPGGRADVEIDVRDELGRHEVLTRSLRVTAAPYVAVLETDRDQYTTGDPVSVVARVSDLDSVPLRSQTLRLEVEGLPTPVEATTDGAGMARFSLRMPAANRKLALSIPGNGGPIADAELQWGEPSPMRTELGSPVVKERQTTTVAAFFPAGYSPAEGRVHMDITDTSGAIVGSMLLPVRREAGRFVARGEFRTPSWGSMLLTFFALGRPDAATNGERPLGLLVSGQDLVVQADRELEVTLEGVPEAARPGSPIAVRARVRDPRGRVGEVTVGAALVDRNILALRDPLEITPVDRFYDPRLRTLSTTGSQILTWPVVTRNWGESVQDIALPPFEWKGGGEVVSCKRYWDADDYAAAGDEPAELSGSGIGLGGVGAVGRGAGFGTRTEITIRTRFPATSLWEPHLRGKGAVDIRGELPDTVGDQELIVVASDQQGGVGMARQPLHVTQPVYVDAELPSPAIAGEQIWVAAVVHNATAQAADFVLESALDATSAPARTLTVQAQSSAAAAVALRFGAPGTSTVRLRAAGAGYDDRVERRIEVVARGIPVSHVRTATVSSAAPLRLSFAVPPGAEDADAYLRVDMPAVTSAFMDVGAIAQVVEDTPWSLAGDLTSAALLLELAERYHRSSAQIDALRSRLLAGLTMAARVQEGDGSYSYWRNARPSAYVTARMLEGLLEARHAGLPVPSAAITAAAQYLAVPLAAGALVDVKDIGWWEGASTRVRLGITAEIFDVLARLEPSEQKDAVGLALRKLADRFGAYLTTEPLDALSAGRALSALIRLGKIPPDQARLIAERLVRQRDQGHFEPSWFHAYGGRLDATLAVLESLQLADPAGFAAEKRDALAWILSTRPSWSTWHAQAETAAALRALALVGAPPAEVASRIWVKLDGALVRTVDIDPKDPFLSAASLAHLDLGEHLRPGQHTVEVTYDGQLRPAVSVVSRVWNPGIPGVLTAKGATIRVKAPGQVQAGTGAALELELAGERLAGGTIVLGASGLLEVDYGELGKLIGPGRAIESVRATERGIELLVGARAAAATVRVPMTATRRGNGHWPAVGWVGRGGDDVGAVVDAGEVGVR